MVVELLRFKNPKFKTIFFKLVGNMLWKNEDRRLTGATTLLIGALVCALFFSKQVAITSLFFLAIGDTLAYVIGYSIGKTNIMGKKTLEGGLAFFTSSVIVVLIMRSINPIVGIAGAFIGCLVELLPWEIDDNLSIPIIAGVVMEALSKFV